MVAGGKDLRALGEQSATPRNECPRGFPHVALAANPPKRHGEFHLAPHTGGGSRCARLPPATLFDHFVVGSEPTLNRDGPKRVVINLVYQ